MTDLVVTASNVQHASGASLVTGVAGAAITAGMSVYLDTSQQLQPCENDQTAVEAAAVGIATHDAAAGQPLTYIKGGNINPGATVVLGETYVVGAGAGGIAPVADLGTGDFVTILAIATTTSNLKLGINVSGIAHA